MVSHDPSTLTDFCNMGAVLHNGTLERFDSINDALQAHHDLQRVHA